MVEIKQLDLSQMEEALKFLQASEETTLFLINNLKTHGPKLTEHHNSGNFRLILAEDQIVGVYCLTRRGNLLLQGSTTTINPHLIIDDCKSNEINLKGFIGDWSSVEPVYLRFKDQNANYSPSFYSKEILYKLPLGTDNHTLTHSPQVRLLEWTDFEAWYSLNLAYNEELNVPNDLTAEQHKKDFEMRIQEKTW